MDKMHQLPPDLRKLMHQLELLEEELCAHRVKARRDEEQARSREASGRRKMPWWQMLNAELKAGSTWHRPLCRAELLGMPLTAGIGAGR